MQRVNFRLPDRDANYLEQLVREGVYPNRSEALREAVRDFVERRREQQQQVTDDGTQH